MAQAAGRHFDPQLFEVFKGILPVIRQICDMVRD
jgi:response regulator RpfG family c-di-GMP phosphodiesterase